MKPRSMASRFLERRARAVRGRPGRRRGSARVDSKNRQLVVLRAFGRLQSPGRRFSCPRRCTPCPGSRDRRGVRHQLQEPADRGAALVQLARGVEEARPVANVVAGGCCRGAAFECGSRRRRRSGVLGDVGLDGGRSRSVRAGQGGLEPGREGGLVRDFHGVSARRGPPLSNEAMTARVLVLASSTLGWSKGSMPRDHA